MLAIGAAGAPAGAVVSRGRLRLRNQAQHSAAAGAGGRARNRGPGLTSAEDVLALKPDGVFLSNGPGDPEPLTHQAAQVRKLIGKKPMFGICLGHQILGLALGGQDLQAEVRASRRQSSGAESNHAKSGDHVAQSRLRGGSRFAQSERGGTDAHESERPDAWRASAIAASRCSACSIIRKPRPVRTIRTTCLTTS